MFAKVAERLAIEGAEVNKTDGVRVKTSDDWWFLRASNTKEVPVARAESTNQAGLNRLMATINGQFEQSGIEAIDGGQ